MTYALAVSVFVCIAVGAGLVLTIRRIASPAAPLPATLDWIDELSLDRYRPMLRLLNEEELAFLRTQPGYTPELAARYRRQRCQIFRGYLRSLTCDFNRVTNALKALLLQAGLDRPDLARLLFRSRLAFLGGILAAYLRLAFYARGIGTVNAAALLDRFDRMRIELRALAPQVMAAVA